MGIATVQAWKNSSNSGASLSVAFNSVPTAGNLLVAVAVVEQGTTRTLSLSDTIGDGVAWVYDIDATNSFGDGHIYICHKIVGTPSGGGKTVTTTPNISSVNVLGIAEFSGVDPANPVDGTPKQASGSSATGSPGAMAVRSGSLVVGAILTNATGTRS